MAQNSLQKFLLICALLAVILWAGSGFIQVLLFSENTSRTVTPRGDLASFEKTSINLFRKSAPSVAYIYPLKQSVDFFGRQQQQRSTGSGFVWDKAGHIITNNHVVSNASQVYVRFDTGEAVTARVIGASQDHDLAVLRVRMDPSKLSPIPVGSSSDLQIGQSVFAIGNPFGLTRTLTTGIVSALNRDLPTDSGHQITGVIQTDAAINPGNSGGPLLDSAGRLIGVNTAIASPTGSSTGIGFAVPVDTVNRIVPQLIRKGKAERPGIGIQAASEEWAANLGIRGIIVISVQPGGPAEQAGLQGIARSTRQLGDVITEVNGTAVNNVSELSTELSRIGVNKETTLTIIRKERKIKVKIKIADIS